HLPYSGLQEVYRTDVRCQGISGYFFTTSPGSALAASASLEPRSSAPSSSGLGHHPLKVAARVRIPLGLQDGLSFAEEVDDLLLTAVLGPASCRRVELEVDDRRVGSPRQEVADQLDVPVTGSRVEGGAAGTAHQGAAVVEGVDVEPDVEHEADGVAAPEL